MRRPSWSAVIVSSLAITGLIVGGTAYAASATTDEPDTFYACTNDVTGALRVIDPNQDQACDDRIGPTHETLISWSRVAGPAGPPGPEGPRGPRGRTGDGGGSVDELGDLAGMSCMSGSQRGKVVLSVQPPERGSVITLICKTRGTVAGPGAPATPAPPTLPRLTTPAAPPPLDISVQPTRTQSPPTTTAIPLPPGP